MLETLLTPDVVKGRPIRLMFQDEARFGRMVRIQRCWAPAPQRPVVDNGYEREFQYVYGGVSPEWPLVKAPKIAGSAFPVSAAMGYFHEAVTRSVEQRISFGPAFYRARLFAVGSERH